MSKSIFMCLVYKEENLLDFFDRPCHSSLVGILSRRIKGERKRVNTISLKQKIASLEVVDGLVLTTLLNDVKFEKGLGVYF